MKWNRALILMPIDSYRRVNYFDYLFVEIMKMAQLWPSKDWAKVAHYYYHKWLAKQFWDKLALKWTFSPIKFPLLGIIEKLKNSATEKLITLSVYNYLIRFSTYVKLIWKTYEFFDFWVRSPFALRPYLPHFSNWTTGHQKPN